MENPKVPEKVDIRFPLGALLVSILVLASQVLRQNSDEGIDDFASCLNLSYEIGDDLRCVADLPNRYIKLNGVLSGRAREVYDLKRADYYSGCIYDLVLDLQRQFSTLSKGQDSEVMASARNSFYLNRVETINEVCFKDSNSFGYGLRGFVAKHRTELLSQLASFGITGETAYNFLGIKRARDEY